MERDNWRSYLPKYHFPPFLRTCFTCLAIWVSGAGILIFLILPVVFTYINSFDAQPIYDISVGSFLDLDVYRLVLLAVENDTRCPGEAVCSPPGSVGVRFRITFDQSEYIVEFSEARDFSEVASLPLGYLARIIQVSPDSAVDPNAYTVRFQIFQPPEDG